MCPTNSSTRAATWEDGDAYDEQAERLASMFRENFKPFEANVSQGGQGGRSQVVSHRMRMCRDDLRGVYFILTHVASASSARRDQRQMLVVEHRKVNHFTVSNAFVDRAHLIF